MGRGAHSTARDRVVRTVLAAGLLLAPLPLHGQWRAEARVGRFDFRLGPQEVPATTSLGVGLGYERPAGWFRLAAGVPTGAEDPLWGSADAGGRLATERGRVAVGIDLSGQGFLQRYTRQLERPGDLFEPPTVIEGTETGYGLAAQTLPFAALRLGPATLRASGGWAGYRSGLGEQQATRHVGLAGVHLGVQPAPTVLLGVDGRQYWADGTTYRFAGGTLAWVLPVATLWGSLGHWVEPASQPLAWAAGADVPIGRRLELALQAREDSFDPLYGSAPRRSWTLGLRVKLGAVESPAPPVPAAYENGRATIRLPAARVRGTPRIAGDFNDWTPQPMTRSGDDWTFVVALAPGVYEYAFVDEDGTWFVPPSVPGRRDDGMGGHVALLVVGGDA